MTRTRVAKGLILALLPILSVTCAQAPKADYPAAPVPFTDVHLTDAFWAPRLETNRTVTIPHIFKQSEETGRVKNFELAEAALGGAMDGKYCSRFPFDDSDVYKIIEAASYALATHADPELEKYVDGLIAKIAAAQEPDGYLYAARTIGGPPPQDWLGKERWSHLYMSHELYNVGHLYEAAAAHFQATGKKNLLAIATKNADLVAKEFGPGKRTNPPGHEEIEIGLVKLYRVTGTKKYLDQAKFFIDARGKTEGRIPYGREGRERLLYGEYAQDDKPFIEQTTAVGHAVRAGYLYAGAADVAALTGDQAYIAALDKIWADVVGTKLYITGGIGAAGAWEGYGPPYRLPNASAYAETCANIATFLWNSRMQRLGLDAKYADVMERILYNGVLSGISLSGDRFFYPNPLASYGQHERVPWFSCACCPPNVARVLASVPGYFYAATSDRIYVNLFAQGTAKLRAGGTDLEVVQTTEYPWKGDVRIEVKPKKAAELTLAVRIPGWAMNRPVPSDLYSYTEPAEDSPTLKVNGEAVELIMDKGYALVSRTWQAGDTVELSLPMPIRRVAAHEAVEADRVRVAVERGPLVYCAEWPDNDGRVSNLVLADGAPLAAEARPDLLGGIVVIRGETEALGEKAGKVVTEKKALTLIPYYAWANRGKGEMTVWLARDPAKARIAREPGLAATAKVTASERAVNPRRANDQFEPEGSDDAASYMHWWPKKGTAEWIDYTFDAPVRVSEASVYWFDDTGGGECRVPVSWRILYKVGEDWRPVKAAGEYAVTKDAWNTIKFAPVRTTALRLEVQMQKEWSAGVHEWKVK
ncbi:MAG: six-hairpin glycosidase [Candidatus Aminicenantes bacterium RBG_19FT_COMBO_65_30]|nr:MAG: six-hairpin glycosidase [Candidatus Aminicenantes bacterium RBG_19FT_COMBO_65_30]